jgi:lipopolysaccharide transport system ATP-binding protein
VRNLTKTYRIFGHPGDRLKQALTLGMRRYHREFTALRGVSFDIGKGEAVAVVGRNGSGKSTLLQLICGILKPSSGSVTTSGRISALLELGAGFHRELTGRENVYFQAAIIGMSQEEISARFDQIAAFADIGEFIDQPVWTYSSGMFVRLAFSVAIHVDPEILVVDEALAVGDIGFQARCFRRMDELREAGRTLIFVSHAGDHVTRTCNRCLLLDRGELLLSGDSRSVLGGYQRLLNASPGAREHVRESVRRQNPGEIAESDDSHRPGDSPAGIAGDDGSEFLDPELIPRGAIAYDPRGATIEQVRITTPSGRRVNVLNSGREYRYAYRVRFHQDARQVRFGMLIRTSSGMELGGAASSPDRSSGLPLAEAGSAVDVEFNFTCMLNAGTYFVNAGVTGSADGEEIILHRILDAAIFRVVAAPRSTATSMIDFRCSAEVRGAGAARV